MIKDTNDLGSNSEEYDSNKSPVINTDANTHTQSDLFIPLPRATDFNSTNGLLSFYLQKYIQELLQDIGLTVSKRTELQA